MRIRTRDRLTRSTLFSGTALAAAFTLLLPTAAHAIVYGVPTNGAHPYVGSLVMLYNPDGPGGVEPFPVQLCTGTLVSERVVLSASHCLQRDEIPAAYEGDPWFTFDEVIDADGDFVVDADVELLTGTAVPHPSYAAASNYRYDSGAFVLDEPATGIAPAELAPVGALEQKAAKSTTYVAVGYGIVRETRKKSTQSFLPPQRRMMAEQPLNNITRDFAYFSMNQAKGDGGTCYGDSGGPHFAPDGRIVAVTTTGDIPCKATDKAYRVDTRIANDFIDALVRRFG